MTLPLVISPGDLGHISNHEEIHSYLAPIVTPFSIAQDASGTLAARPAAGTPGRYYLATDAGVLYRDSGSGWQPVHDMLTTWEASLLTSGNNFAKLKMPTCIATKTVAQTISNATETVITFPTEDFDNDGMHSVSTNTGRILANRAGVYLAIAHLDWDIGPDATVTRFRIDGATLTGHGAIGTGGHTSASVASTFLVLNAASYVEVLGAPISNPAASVDCTGGRFQMSMLTSL